MDRLIGDDEDLPKPLDIKPPGAPLTTTPKVCIIGAGAAGLFTALLIDYLNNYLQNVTKVEGFVPIQYDIFESEDKTRGVGGRLYTYKFSDAPHDYYDVGAMRFPENPIMARYVEERC